MSGVLILSMCLQRPSEGLCPGRAEYGWLCSDWGWLCPDCGWGCVHEFGLWCPDCVSCVLTWGCSILPGHLGLVGQYPLLGIISLLWLKEYHQTTNILSSINLGLCPDWCWLCPNCVYVVSWQELKSWAWVIVSWLCVFVSWQAKHVLSDVLFVSLNEGLVNS